MYVHTYTYAADVHTYQQIVSSVSRGSRGSFQPALLAFRFVLCCPLLSEQFEQFLKWYTYIRVTTAELSYDAHLIIDRITFRNVFDIFILYLNCTIFTSHRVIHIVIVTEQTNAPFPNINYFFYHKKSLPIQSMNELQYSLWLCCNCCFYFGENDEQNEHR